MKGGYTKKDSKRPNTRNRLPITGEIMGEGEKYTFRDELQKKRTRRARQKEKEKNKKFQARERKKTIKKLREAREVRQARQKRANTQYNINDKKGLPVKLVIDNKPNPRNSLLQGLRSSIKPLKNVKVKLPTPRSISMKTGSRRLISALVSNRFKQEMAPRATRATRIAKTI